MTKSIQHCFVKRVYFHFSLDKVYLFRFLHDRADRHKPLTGAREVWEGQQSEEVRNEVAKVWLVTLFKALLQVFGDLAVTTALWMCADVFKGIFYCLVNIISPHRQGTVIKRILSRSLHKVLEVVKRLMENNLERLLFLLVIRVFLDVGFARAVPHFCMFFVH